MQLALQKLPFSVDVPPCKFNRTDEYAEWKCVKMRHLSTTDTVELDAFIRVDLGMVIQLSSRIKNTSDMNSTDPIYESLNNSGLHENLTIRL